MEMNGRPKCEWPKADVLILAGDIWNAALLKPKGNDAKSRSHKKAAQYLIDDVFPLYDRVFAVMGNHEHYGSYFDETEKFIEEFHKDCPNFKLLNGEKRYFNDVVFIGATLWTDFNKGNPVDMAICQQFMNDYRCIGKYADKTVTALDILRAHDDDINIMDTLLSVNVFGDQKVVFITHHPPTLKSLNRAHSGNGLDPAFASDLSSFIEEHPQINMWFHGHTHADIDYECFNTRILANQHGYSHEPQSKKFKVKVVELDVSHPENSEDDAT